MKILIIKVSAIGDVIHTLPAIFYLKKIFPNAQISWVVQKKAADLIINQPFLEEVFTLPDKFLHPKNWSKTFKIIKKLRQKKWDAIIDFQGIHKTSLLISLLKGKKFGFDNKLVRSKFSTWFTDKKANFEFKNIIQKNLGLASHVAQDICYSHASFITPFINQCPSIAELKKDFYFNFDLKNKKLVDNWLNSERLDKFILLCPNTTCKTKHWPEESWVEFIKILLQEKLHHKILLVGQSFGKAAKEITKQSNGQKLAIHVVPEWNLNTTAYLISKANLLIAPDTGLLHLADFLNIKTIGIFGPTSAKQQGPFLKDINTKNVIQVTNIPKDSIDYNNNTNKSNFQKATVSQNIMYKLKPNMLLEKTLVILKEQN